MTPWDMWSVYLRPPFPKRVRLTTDEDSYQEHGLHHMPDQGCGASEQASGGTIKHRLWSRNLGRALAIAHV